MWISWALSRARSSGTQVLPGLSQWYHASFCKASVPEPSLEAMKKGQKHLTEKPQHPRHSVCLYVPLKRETKLLQTDKRRGRVIAYGWTRRQVSLIAVGAGSAEEQLWVSGERKFRRHFLHTRSVLSLGPKEGFALPLSLSWSRGVRVLVTPTAMSIA